MIKKEKIIYVLIPRSIVTGGTESLHQLAYELKKIHEMVFIYYMDSRELTQPKKFENYRVPIVNEISDSSENLIIVSETNTEYLNKYNKIKKCIWWLSLDYYIRQLPQKAPYYFCIKHKIPLFMEPIISKTLHLTGKIKTDIYSFDNKYPVFHLYNCEYVRQYLKKRGVSDKSMMYLCGPIGDEYFERKIEEKKNIIAYNPAKGYESTQKIINEVEKRELDFKFVPIKNLDTQGVIDLLSVAKVYIDFGYFPGPERIPREAVTLNTNIISSLSGSANNEIDVPLPKDCKFDLSNFDENIDKVIEKLNDLITNYTSHLPKYDNYRKKVVEQKEIFNLNLNEFYNRNI